jgi:hypothetical protein
MLEAEKDKSQSVNKTVRVHPKSQQKQPEDSMSTLRISGEPTLQFKSRGPIYTGDRFSNIEELFERITTVPDMTTTITISYMTTNKIDSIKLVRAKMGYGLKEAKELVEFCERNAMDIHMTHW